MSYPTRPVIHPVTEAERSWRRQEAAWRKDSCGGSKFEHNITLDDVTYKVSTAKALLVEYEGEEYWLPVTQIVDFDFERRRGSVGSITISEWIAREKGIID